MRNQDETWFWLCNIPGIYQETLKKLIAAYGSPDEILRESANTLERRGLLSEKQALAFAESKKSLKALSLLDQITKEGILFLHPESEAFPEKLKMIPDPPFSLYVKGNLPDASLPAAGMVGARASTEYGKKMALRFAGTLAAAGVQIVSGMAAGIDGMSAKGALAAGGKTFAVLGSGVDVIYPAENFSLYYEILASGGGIISEYPVGTKPLAWQFPLRNRLISGLSDCLLVMEAKERSGTLITVRYALEQGKEVYALPGRLTDPASVGCNRMIADGAGILISPECLLEEIAGSPNLYRRNSEVSEKKQQAEGGMRTDSGRRKTTKARPDLSGMRKDLKKIFDATSKRAITLQKIIEKTGESPETTASLLAELELLGLVREVSKNNYIRIL